MNPESQYPELATMKSDELFIEKASIRVNNNWLTFPIKKMILKKDKHRFTKELKITYNTDTIYFVTFGDVMWFTVERS
jgi:hypothetical protein